MPLTPHPARPLIGALRLLALPALLLAALAPGLGAAAEPPPFVWIEAESPAASSLKLDPQAAGPAGILSGGRWLQTSLDKGDLEKRLPPEGILLTYPLTAPEPGDYQLWARVGFEWARSPLEWRLGEGPWTKVGTEVLTTNVMRLGTWMEVAWQRLGSVTLPAGETRLQVRVRELNGDRLLFGLDCLALVKGAFAPEGRLKPGETHDSPQDRQAASHLFRVPEAAADRPGERQSVVLRGAWQVARYDDPDMDAGPYEPVKALPSPQQQPLRWMAVDVPSNAWEKPELVFGHRLLYRARVQVPQSARGRGFTLHFSGTNWIASVFVNGRLMGTHKGVLIPWDQDISAGVRPGEVNEIVVAIKGPWYAHDAKTRNTTLNHERNLPNESSFLTWTRWVAPIYPSTKGEGDGTAYGLVNPVTLTVAGPAYVADAFVRTSVREKRLRADLLLLNPGAAPRSLTLRCEAVHQGTGKVERAFPPVEVTVGPEGRESVSVGGEWPNPRLWWPVEKPDLYTLRTTVLEAGRPIDVHEQSFGFREITLDGPRFRINGVVRNFWNWVEVSGNPATPQAFLQAFREEGNRFYRFAHDSLLRRFFPSREERLEFFDRSGIPGRLSTCIDGMFINYNLENPLVWENFGEHIEQMARAYRNHPSIVIYSVENELMYINGQNIYGGLMDSIEDRMFQAIQRGRAMDPTRPYMVDGGGALKGNRLEIDCPHYPEASTDTYPDNAYTLARIADHSSRWPWDRKRPMIVGESFFYSGKLENQAWIGGDRVFRSREEADKAASKYAQLLMEGYRWQGVTGVCPWVAVERIPGAGKSFSALAAFTRKRAYRFTAGRPGSVAVRVFNDTLSAEPVDFEWALLLAGKRAAGGRERISLEPGTSAPRTLRFTLPAAAQRREGQLLLRVAQKGEKSFEDRKPISVLPPVTRIAAGSAGSPVLVLDRSGRLVPFLKARRVPVLALSGLAQLKGKSGLLVVGPDTLTASEAYGHNLLAFAARGGRAIVLEQETPLAGGALPTSVRATARFGGYAFPQALGTPVFAGLREGDFEDWAGDHPTYKRAYLKPSGGARSLVECGDALGYSALFEAPCGRGVLVACQLRVGAKLGLEPAADHLLKNLLERYSRYQPPTGVVGVLAPPDSPIHQALAQAGVLTQPVAGLDAALAPGKLRVLVVSATPANLKALAQARARLDRFTAAGGWVMLWGLEPQGLASFNRLTGLDQPLRPFRLERVTLEAAGHPLTATLGNRDLTFYSPQELMHGDYWLSEHVFTYVVGNGQDVAPFCRMPGGPEDPYAYKPTFDDQDPYNFVNGLFNSDFWRYIRQIWVPEKGADPLVFGLRRPATLRQINLWNNTNYWTIKDLDLIFDGDTAHPLRVVLPPHGGMTPVKLQPARRVAKSVTLQIRSWRGDPIVRDGRELRLVGIDNVQFLQVSPASGGDGSPARSGRQAGTRPVVAGSGPAPKAIALDSVGGLVAYPRGKGGLLLNQIRLLEQEPNPENAGKKVRLVSTLLQNLGAGLRSSAVAVPGVNVEFAPLDITRYCNRHIKARDGQPGWFGEAGRDLGHLKVGQQFLGDVIYHVSDYVNAPVPQSIMLGSPAAGDPIRSLPQAVTGIGVNRKADALYFLHAAQVVSPISPGERSRREFRAPELFRYVVHYADGTTAEVPVLLEEQVDHWLQPSPRALPGAQAAWSVPFPSAAADTPRPALYSMAWTNPRPEVPIATVDVVLGKDGSRAIPAVLAITAGTRAAARR